MSTTPAAARSPGAARSGTAEPPGWHARAACQYTDPELFFPDEAEAGGRAAIQAVDRARGVCVACPVREQCLRYALAKPERAGVWGGLSELELRAERRRRLRRPLAEVMAAADARYLRRRERQVAADERADRAEARQRRDEDLDMLLSLDAA